MRDWSLSRMPLFEGLPPADLAALEATLPELRFPARTIIFREGDHGDRFYVVLEGRIEVLKAMDSADERLLTVLGAGEFVGEMSLLNPDGRRTASLRVLEDARMLEFTRDDFEALLSRYPPLAYTMLRVLSTRLRDSHDATIVICMTRTSGWRGPTQTSKPRRRRSSSRRRSSGSCSSRARSRKACFLTGCRIRPASRSEHAWFRRAWSAGISSTSSRSIPKRLRW